MSVAIVALVLLGMLGNVWDMSATPESQGGNMRGRIEPSPGPLVQPTQKQPLTPVSEIYPHLPLPSSHSQVQPRVQPRVQPQVLPQTPPERPKNGADSAGRTPAKRPPTSAPAPAVLPIVSTANTVDDLVANPANVPEHTLLKRALDMLHPPYEMGQLVNYCGHIYRPHIHMIKTHKQLEALHVLPPGVLSGPFSHPRKGTHGQSQPNMGRANDDVVWLSFFTESGSSGKESKRLMCDFVQNVNQLQRRVIVLTAGRWACGSPWLIPGMSKLGCTKDALQHFMDHPKVLLWFLTQHDSAYRHEKMRPLPIGFFACFWDERHNKHSPFAQPVWTGTNPRTAVHKQAVVHVPYVPSLAPRDRWLYVNYQVHAGRQEVEDAFFAKLPKRPGVDLNALRRSNAFRMEKEPGFDRAIHNYPLDMLSSQFVFSPAGAGEDCWRHWEILIHGGVPIIPGTWPLRMLFEGLPVVFYDEKGNLDSPSGSALDFSAFVKDVERGKYSYEKLTQAYWDDYVNREGNAAIRASNRAQIH